VAPPEPTSPAENGNPLACWVEASLPRALAYASSLVRRRADAEDLVHDCYVRLLAKSHEYDLPNDGVKLLFRSITNACINWHQRQPPTVSLDAATFSTNADRSESSNPEQRAMHRELETAVAEALAELPVVQRAAIELRSLGHSMSEVAEILETTHGNARVVLHRARQALAARLSRFLDVEREADR
jgi:RNA polymerase sigma-70 factor (ECF subfamily)